MECTRSVPKGPRRPLDRVKRGRAGGGGWGAQVHAPGLSACLRADRSPLSSFSRMPMVSAQTPARSGRAAGGGRNHAEPIDTDEKSAARRPGCRRSSVIL
ncbi:hypothetical protein EVAR_19476_1 [Eumeta japonica]|uniref:Uncharacterized protein n=1 Tax=Eumeta variegata TaxID=151549 RepID=A0A4C1V9A0_EUMVA|nr:hypothetical protein EVAR_19476_1 [Eumeta japonica]